MARKEMATETMSVSVPTELVSLLDEYRYRQDLNRSQVVTKAISRFLFAEFSLDPDLRAKFTTQVMGE